MSSHKATLPSAASELDRDPLRSPLFHWLLKKHETFAPYLSGPRPNWLALRDMAVRAKALDGAGNEPTVRTVRVTWRKVESEAIARRSRMATGSKPERQQSPQAAKNWSPPIATAPTTTIPRRSVPGTTITNRPSSDLNDGLTEEARAQLASLERQLKRHDRFMLPLSEREE